MRNAVTLVWGSLRLAPITCYLGNITVQERYIWTTFLDVAWVKGYIYVNQRIKIEIKGEVYSARVETDSEN